MGSSLISCKFYVRSSLFPDSWHSSKLIFLLGPSRVFVSHAYSILITLHHFILNWCNSILPSLYSLNPILLGLSHITSHIHNMCYSELVFSNIGTTKGNFTLHSVCCFYSYYWQFVFIQFLEFQTSEEKFNYVVPHKGATQDDSFLV